MLPPGASRHLLTIWIVILFVGYGLLAVFGGTEEWSWILWTASWAGVGIIWENRLFGDWWRRITRKKKR